MQDATAHGQQVPQAAPDLLDRQFQAPAPNRVWVGDMTFIRTREGWLYLAILLDLFSRRVVGWSMSAKPDHALCLGALGMACEQRRPQAGLIHHTDRGGQYASTIYRAILTRARMRQCMRRAGDYYDNAFVESCFDTLKTELEMSAYHCLEHARREIEEYVNYYNAL